MVAEVVHAAWQLETSKLSVPKLQLRVKLLPQALFKSEQKAVVDVPDFTSRPRVMVLVAPSNVTSSWSPWAHGFGLHPEGLAVRTPKKQLIWMVPAYPLLIGSQDVVSEEPEAITAEGLHGTDVPATVMATLCSGAQPGLQVETS